MIVLGIESSCDETAAALVNEKREILAETVLSQEEHKIYGGVVPEIAARSHLDHIDDVIEHTFHKAGIRPEEVDAIAATSGPGLIGGVVVGVMAAKALSFALGKPFVAVNHLEGHALVSRLTNEVEYPYLLLLVSGGHCQILAVKGVGDYERLGTTIDDAAGEAFDKVAKMLGLGYPGGPKIEKKAKEGNDKAIVFPKAKVAENPYDFSFSGLKSAVLNYINGCKMKRQEINEADIAASFQKAVIDVLVEHAVHAAKEYRIDKFAIAGGVASNQTLREAMEKACKERGIQFYHPSPIFCTDNAAMIGSAAYYEYLQGRRDGWDLNAVPNLKLGER